MSALIRLAVIGIGGLIGSHLYYRWMLSSSIHKLALEQYGLPGYWFWNALPALVVSILFCFHGMMSNRHRKWKIAIYSIVGGVAVAYFGLAGKFLLCVYVTHGICE